MASNTLLILFRFGIPHLFCSFFASAHVSGGSAVCNVELAIFNIHGQKVRDLVNGKFVRGNYEVTWNGTDDAGLRVASGVYLLPLRTGQFAQTRKLMLMR